MTYKNRYGETLYPVCALNGNQHKIYLAHNNVSADVLEGKANFSKLDEVERAIQAFSENIINGVVYATYRDGLLIKKYIK